MYYNQACDLKRQYLICVFLRSSDQWMAHKLYGDAVLSLKRD